MYSFKDTDECSSKISITQNDERMALAPTFYTLIHKTVYHDLIFIQILFYVIVSTQIQRKYLRVHISTVKKLQ